MNIDEKLNLLIAMVADIYDVMSKLAPRVGIDMTLPDAFSKWEESQNKS